MTDSPADTPPRKPGRVARDGLRRRIFVWVTALLLLTDLSFLAINYRLDRASLEVELVDEGRWLYQTYQVVLGEKLESMLMLAELFADMPPVREIMAQADRTIAAEGGGPGGARSAELRNRLNDLLAPSWRRVTRRHDVRQLHFHLGPRALSFLRVHRPDRFGDLLEDVRFTLVDTYRDEIPRTGFELGRVYAGLRGVVPLRPTGGGRVIGTVEVGTSYRPLLDLLDRTLDAGFAVLLKRSRVEEAMWADFMAERFTSFDECDCVIEASSRPTIESLIPLLSPATDVDGPVTDLIDYQGRALALTQWPIYDYVSARDQTDSVGRVLAWRDVTDRIDAFWADQRLSVAYGIAAFLLLEVALWAAIRFATRRLRSEVDQRTREIRDLNQRLTHQAEHDALTGLMTRHALFERLPGLFAEARQHNRPLSVLLLDLDHFKQLNDTYGHLVGDRALTLVGETLHKQLRPTDLAIRLGGEELACILVNADIEQARVTAQHLRAAIADLAVPTGTGTVPLTTSIGVAEWVPSESEDTWLARADTGLYAAKRGGRNRVCVIDGTDGQS